MKAFLVALSLFLSSSAGHAGTQPPCPEGETCYVAAPTQPPRFVPAPPAHSTPGEGDDDDDDIPDILKAMLAHQSVPSPKIVCTTHPCVPAYRLAGPINDESASNFERFMAAATEAKPDMVMIELNTLGGMLSAAHEISRQMEHAPFKVVCVVDGDAVSAGMYILASCDTRVMTKRSELMVHAVALMNSERARVTKTTIENQQSLIQVSTRCYIEWVTHRMKGVTVPEVLAKVANDHEWWMNWEEAVKIGAVDKVVDVPPDAYLSQLKKTGKP